ncbi:GTPase-activating protein [Scheffersomyces spartinae]|uniref:GTPase-activating protein GYP5 n=1 Tax=Scheffersomyces spartinae TaxID=45513 RepID=A0A9P8AIQ6_9ASCO|nr:GTPase-activating protein [Scheffersomyces spartinae]KAG7193935.1 GTPase-activating protein [Scheffersomyces spartinae]
MNYSPDKQDRENGQRPPAPSPLTDAGSSPGDAGDTSFESAAGTGITDSELYYEDDDVNVDPIQVEEITQEDNDNSATNDTDVDISTHTTILNLSSLDVPASEEKSDVSEEVEEHPKEIELEEENKPTLPDKTHIKRWINVLVDGEVLDVSLEIESSTNQQNITQLKFINKSYDRSSNNFLLQSKFNQLRQTFEAKDTNAKDLIEHGTENIKRSFNDVKNSISGFANGPTEGSYTEAPTSEIDWDFWTRTVSNYGLVIEDESDELSNAISNGIPKEFRGIIWQLVARSKNKEMEDFYVQLKKEHSVHEKSIKRDLARTSFFTNIEKSKQADELFELIKCYSIFDSEVGYTQGMIFIGVPLIMNMSGPEAFCLLVALMKDYGFRELFVKDMKGLHLLLYEFDRLLELYSPLLYNHLSKQGIKSSMYATQWFLTLFAYKFPLSMVLRIYDMVITEGLECILKFAVNLMIKNENSLLRLSFDELVDFLTEKLFNIYVNEEYIEERSLEVSPSQEGRRPSFFGGVLGGTNSSKIPVRRNNSIDSISGSNYYNLNELVKDSNTINISPFELKKFEFEFEKLLKIEKQKVQKINQLQAENGQLRNEIKELEMKYSDITKEHANNVQNMVYIKVNLQECSNDIQDLEDAIAKLKQNISDYETSSTDVNSSLPSRDSVTDDERTRSGSVSLVSKNARIEDDITDLLAINAQEMEKNATLEERLRALILEEKDLKSTLNKHKKNTWFKW